MGNRPEFLAVFIITVFLVLAGCSINVKKNGEGEDKNVDIKTPFTDIHVEKNADVRDTGLAVYPGARPTPKTGNDESSANVDLSAFGYGLKVVVLKYESDDDPNKLQKFYEGELKKYGSVLQCHSSHLGHDYGGGRPHDPSGQLKCTGDNTGNIIELKAGTENNQHIVSIEPQGKGSDFALVYVRVRGKEGTI